MAITMASLFDGIGGFPKAGLRYGIKTLWASEIETFPISVTKLRFPEMAHMGNICGLNGADLPPVDIVCGGFPCQDISNANGARQGLAGSRSGLFFEMIRIIQEMRDEDIRNGRSGMFVRPRFVVAENVPGLFSSGEPPREDFRVVIEEFVRVKHPACHVPRPDAGKWESDGAIILGDEFSLAWRVLDARFWPGTPQRRRRIFFVVDYGGRAAPSVCFERFGLPWDSQAGPETGKASAAGTQGGAGISGGYPARTVGGMAESG